MASGNPRCRACPKLHADLWEQYKAKLPDDIEIRRYLVRGRNFNDRTVDTFIQEYKSTLEFRA